MQVCITVKFKTLLSTETSEEQSKDWFSQTVELFSDSLKKHDTPVKNYLSLFFGFLTEVRLQVENINWIKT